MKLKPTPQGICTFTYRVFAKAFVVPYRRVHGFFLGGRQHRISPYYVISLNHRVLKAVVGVYKQWFNISGIYFTTFYRSLQAFVGKETGS